MAGIHNASTRPFIQHPHTHTPTHPHTHTPTTHPLTPAPRQHPPSRQTAAPGTARGPAAAAARCGRAGCACSCRRPGAAPGSRAPRPPRTPRPGCCWRRRSGGWSRCDWLGLGCVVVTSCCGSWRDTTKHNAAHNTHRTPPHTHAKNESHVALSAKGKPQGLLSLFGVNAITRPDPSVPLGAHSRDAPSTRTSPENGVVRRLVVRLAVLTPMLRMEMDGSWPSAGTARMDWKTMVAVPLQS